MEGIEISHFLSLQTFGSTLKRKKKKEEEEERRRRRRKKMDPRKKTDSKGVSSGKLMPMTEKVVRAVKMDQQRKRKLNDEKLACLEVQAKESVEEKKPRQAFEEAFSRAKDAVQKVKEEAKPLGTREKVIVKRIPFPFPMTHVCLLNLAMCPACIKRTRGRPAVQFPDGNVSLNLIVCKGCLQKNQAVYTMLTE